MTSVIVWLEEVVGAIPLPLLEVWGRFSYRRRPGAGHLRLRRLHVPNRRVVGIRPGAADVGCEGVPEPAADVRADHRDRLHRIVRRICRGRTDVRVLEGPGRSAVHRALRLSRADRRPTGLHAVGPDRGGAARVRPELGRGLLLLDGLCLDGLSVHRPESGLPPGADLASLRRVRCADHAVRPGHVGFHLLSEVHLRHLLPEHLVSAVLHVDRDLAHGAPGLSRRPAAGQTVWMVLGGNSWTRQRARDWRERMDLGSGPQPDAGERWPVREGLPIRIFLFTPFIALVLVMVGATAMVALRSADDDAATLATRLHQEASAGIRKRLDDYLARSSSQTDADAPTRSSRYCEARPSARTVEPSFSTTPARSSPPPLPTETRWWRVRSPVSRSTPVRRACLKPRRSSGSIT